MIESEDAAEPGVRIIHGSDTEVLAETLQR